MYVLKVSIHNFMLQNIFNTTIIFTSINECFSNHLTYSILDKVFDLFVVFVTYIKTSSKLNKV